LGQLNQNYFCLNCPLFAENKNIVFSGIGLKKQEIVITGLTRVDVVMQTEVTNLAEINVVSTGYQTISKERATGSFGKVTDEMLSKRPVSNIGDALNGQIAGLVSDPTTGIIIRGRSSLSTNANDRRPLLVVDGFPIEGGFETINPNDVKSVDVMKDAAATSIYGARAANGVIVITTKGMGTKGKMDITYNSFVSIGEQIDLDHYMNMVDSKAHIEFDDYFYNTFKGTTSIRDPWLSSTFRGRLSEYFTLIAERDKGNITEGYFDQEKQRMLNNSYKDDYYKYVLRNSVSQQQNLIISGSGDRNSYKFSLLYDNDKTYLQNNNKDKYILGFTNVYNITNNIKYTFNSNLTFYNNKLNAVNLGYAKSVTSPWTKIFDEDGNYARHIHSYYEPAAKSFETRLPFSMRYNFLEESALRDNLYRGLDLRLQNEFAIKIAEGLSINPMLQYEFFNDENRSIYDERSFAVRNAANIIASPDVNNTYNFTSQLPAGGIYRYNGGQRRSAFKIRIQGNYDKTIATKHSIAAVAGGEVITSKTEQDPEDLKFGYSREGLNYALFDYNVSRNNIFGENITSGPPTYEGVNFGTPSTFYRQAVIYNERYIAAYANASYTFDRRYTLTASMRTDASNYISRTNRERFSPFYSTGIRWNLLNEKFMQNARNIDRLAIRLTYGSTGNAAGKTSILPFSVFSAQSPNSETGNYPGGAISGRLNDLLTWEKTFSTNLGTDFSFFNGMLTGSIDVYRRYSKDLLTSVQTSNAIWSTLSQTINAAKVLNKGVEVTLGSNVNITDDFTWNSSLNFDYNYNEVLEYNWLSTNLISYVGSTTFIKGLPTDRIMVVKLAGTTKEGFFIQQKKNGELVTEINSNYQFAGFGTMSNTYPGRNVKDDDRIYYMGRSTPPANIGFSNSFNWKGLTLMTVMTGRFGHLIRRSDTYLGFGQGTPGYSASGMEVLLPPSAYATGYTGNILPTLANRQVYSTSNTTRAYYSDVVVEKGSSFRLNEIYLGYEFPKQLLTQMGNLFKSATIYSQIRNLGVLWTNNESKIDPDYMPGTLKPYKTYTFGIRVGF